MIIRALKKSDYAQILAIYAPYVENTSVSLETEVPAEDVFFSRLDRISSRFPFIVAEENGEITGYAYLDSFHERAAYAPTCDLSVYCREGHTGHGTGLALCVVIEELAVQRGFSNIVSIITELNPGSLKFHKRHGFEEIGFFPHVAYKHGRWLGCYYMMKALDGGQEAPSVDFSPLPQDFKVILP